MTGFAARDGAGAGWRWTWEVRSVNGRGLDLRFRVPDWPPEVEARARAALQGKVSRGNVTVSLRLMQEDEATQPQLNPAALEAALALAATVEARATNAGLTLAPMTAADVLGMRGIVEASSGDTQDPASVRDAVMADFDALITALVEMRSAEGATLEGVLRGQVDAIAATVQAARDIAGPRSAHLMQSFHDALARVADRLEPPDAQRVAQEIAALAVKADVTEELDRLEAHVASARGLLDGPGPKGRKLDFLTQEFNREANTLCAKAGYAELTRLGLDLKHTVDQMREQVQNVE